MARLHIIAEGPTEERFVKDVLNPHLSVLGVFADARSVMTSRDGPRFFRGGLKDYAKPKRDITLWIRQEQKQPDAWFTTMFDLYALPSDFPGYADASREPTPYKRVARLEAAFGLDVNCHHFIPYVQLHEFEALILAEPQKLEGEFPEHAAAITSLAELSAGKAPEEINDGETTAPSKRIIQAIPEYKDRKATAGPIVAGKIGLETLRARCRHFNEWVQRLESLGRVQSEQ